jgi:hypothetical protein
MRTIFVDTSSTAKHTVVRSNRRSDQRTMTENGVDSAQALVPVHCWGVVKHSLWFGFDEGALPFGGKLHGNKLS